jgi:hypothetical protein
MTRHALPQYNIRRRLQVMKLLITQLSATSFTTSFQTPKILLSTNNTGLYDTGCYKTRARKHLEFPECGPCDEVQHIRSIY